METARTNPPATRPIAPVAIKPPREAPAVTTLGVAVATAVPFEAVPVALPVVLLPVAEAVAPAPVAVGTAAALVLVQAWREEMVLNIRDAAYAS